MNKSVILVLIFLCTNIITKGKDYYVKNSVLQSGNGTETAPFKTIQEAAFIMKPGDNCYISEGTYPETIIPSNSGNPDAPITFQPWHQDDKVQITGLNRIHSEEWVPYGKTLYMTKVNLKLELSGWVLHLT